MYLRPSEIAPVDLLEDCWSAELKFSWDSIQMRCSSREAEMMLECSWNESLGDQTDKYILQFERITFAIWHKYSLLFETNVFYKFKQIHFAISDRYIQDFKKNTFWTLRKINFAFWDQYISQFRSARWYLSQLVIHISCKIASQIAWVGARDASASKMKYGRRTFK